MPKHTKKIEDAQDLNFVNPYEEPLDDEEDDNLEEWYEHEYNEDNED